MRFETENDVKKWLRGLSLLKKDLMMKSEFYSDLIKMTAKTQGLSKKYTEYYLKQIEKLHNKIKILANDMEKAFDTLNGEERGVLTAKYIKGVPWDIMELHVHYSRRQAIRIHNNAVKKLIGFQVKGEKYIGK